LKREPGTDLRLVCYCFFHKTAADIKAEVLRLELKTRDQVFRRILAGVACTLCLPDVEAILAEAWKHSTPPPTSHFEGGGSD